MGCAAPNPLHWQDLRDTPRSQVQAKRAVSSAQAAACFALRFLDQRFLIDARRERVELLDAPRGGPVSQELAILLIRYLTTPLPGGLDGSQVNEKELPGGATFFRGPHALPVHAMLERYGHDRPGFEARARELGAEPVAAGNAAFVFLPFPETPVTLVLWQADEEFPAQISALFDRSIQRWFPLDMVFLLVRQLSERIARPDCT